MNASLRDVAVVKMHGTHNDFIVLDERPPRIENYAALARSACDRERGLGADGLLVIGAAAGAEASMRTFNADGSEAEMCGNGVRCVARYLAERGPGDAFTIATAAGPVQTTVVARQPEFRVRVEMGGVEFPGGAQPEEIEAAGAAWTYYSASTGNPHIVIFVADAALVDLQRAGPALATHARFPHGTNVHFVEMLAPPALRVRHWERGAGATQSCGTGALACAAVAIRVRGAVSPVRVEVPGGTLEVEWSAGMRAALTGPAEVVGERTLAV